MGSEYNSVEILVPRLIRPRKASKLQKLEQDPGIQSRIISTAFTPFRPL